MSVCTQYAGVLCLPRGAGSLQGILPLLDLQLRERSLHAVHLRRLQGQLKPLLQRVLLPLLLPGLGLGQLLRLQDLLQLLQPLVLLLRGTFRVRGLPAAAGGQEVVLRLAGEGAGWQYGLHSCVS